MGLYSGAEPKPEREKMATIKLMNSKDGPTTAARAQRRRERVAEVFWENVERAGVSIKHLRPLIDTAPTDIRRSRAFLNLKSWVRVAEESGLAEACERVPPITNHCEFLPKR